MTPLMEVLTCKCGKLFESTNRNGLACRACMIKSVKAYIDKADSDMVERVKNNTRREND